ncbi:MAG: hypothetical protein IT450_21690 [Phycisphaerales bacterium]|nr:hypothetical protein [Phycisphaerales bacterium]
MTNRNLFRGVGGIATAAAIILAFAWFAPHSPKSATNTLDAVQAAFRTLDDVAAVEIETEWHSGDGEPPNDGGTVTVLRGVGYAGRSIGGEIEVYNLVEQRRYRTQSGGQELVTVRMTDQGMIEEMLRRTRVAECAEYFNISRREAIVDRVEIRDGRAIRHIEALDTQRRPVTIELDVETDRLLLVDSRFGTDIPGQTMRQIVRFRYPAPESIDRSIFDPPSTEGKRVIEEPASKMQCMVNARNLCMAVMVYAQEHDNQLPPNIDALARYAPGGDLATCRTCLFTDGGEAVEMIYSTPESLGITTINDLQPEMILFRCRIQGGEVLGFGDGHAEFRASAD